MASECCEPARASASRKTRLQTFDGLGAEEGQADPFEEFIKQLQQQNEYVEAFLRNFQDQHEKLLKRQETMVNEAVANAAAASEAASAAAKAATEAVEASEKASMSPTGSLRSARRSKKNRTRTHELDSESGQTTDSQSVTSRSPKTSDGGASPNDDSDGEGPRVVRKRRKKRKQLKKFIDQKAVAQEVSSGFQRVSAAFLSADPSTRMSVASHKARAAETKEPSNGRIARVVHNKSFTAFSMGLIFTNTIFITIQIQWAADNLEKGQQPAALNAVDLVFCVLFALELLMRIIAERAGFFCGRDMRWNVFDTVLVMLQIQDSITMFALLSQGQATLAVQGTDGESGGSNFTFLRIVRVLRVLRVVRLFKFCPQLTIILTEILGSMTAVLWLFALLGVILFILGLVFMTASTDFRKSGGGSQELRDDLERWFGSVPVSVVSLFKAMSGGMPWESVADAMMEVSALYGWVMLGFLAFALLGVMNIVTGVFVESAARTSEQSREEEAQAYLDHLDGLLKSFDPLKIGEVKRVDFFSRVGDEDMHEFLQRAHMSASEACHIFDLLDIDHTEALNLDLFVKQFKRLTLRMKVADVVTLQLLCSRLDGDQRRFRSYVEQCFHVIGRTLGIKDAMMTPMVAK